MRQGELTTLSSPDMAAANAYALRVAEAVGATVVDATSPTDIDRVLDEIGDAMKVVVIGGGLQCVRGPHPWVTVGEAFRKLRQLAYLANRAVMVVVRESKGGSTPTKVYYSASATIMRSADTAIRVVDGRPRAVKYRSAHPIFY